MVLTLHFAKRSYINTAIGNNDGMSDIRINFFENATEIYLFMV